MLRILFTAAFVFFCANFAAAQDDYHKFEVSGNYSYERTKGFYGDRFQNTLPDSGTSNTYFTGENRTHNLNGFNASAAYNFSRYFGAKVEFSGNFGSDNNHELPGGIYRSTTAGTLLIIPNQISIPARQRDFKYMGGAQYKDNSTEKRFKPFAHALFGTAQQTTDFYDIDQQRTNLIGGSRKIKNSGFTMALGGGLDVRVSKRIDIRVIQFDYNPIFMKEKTLLALGAQVDSRNANFPGGSIVTTLQDLKIPKHTQQNFRIGFGIVFH